MKSKKVYKEKPIFSIINNKMSKSDVKKTITAAQLYGEAGLIYIRYHADIIQKSNGHKKIKSWDMPCFSDIQEQPVYKPGSGEYYSLLMGREFKPGRYIILLDFDNKVDLESKNGLELAKLLNMDQYKAPKQTTPNGGLHYLFYVDANQAVQIRSRTGLLFMAPNIMLT